MENVILSLCIVGFICIISVCIVAIDAINKLTKAISRFEFHLVIDDAVPVTLFPIQKLIKPKETSDQTKPTKVIPKRKKTK